MQTYKTNSGFMKSLESSIRKLDIGWAGWDVRAPRESRYGELDRTVRARIVVSPEQAEAIEAMLIEDERFTIIETTMLEKGIRVGWTAYVVTGARDPKAVQKRADEIARKAASEAKRAQVEANLKAAADRLRPVLQDWVGAGDENSPSVSFIGGRFDQYRSPRVTISLTLAEADELTSLLRSLDDKSFE